MSERDEVERLRAELDRTRAELDRIQAELEEFAYAASHDLAEPLRAINGFVGLLAQRYEGALGEDADEFIGFITDATERMQAMIDGLLRYSRAGRQELAVEAVPLEEIVTLARARLREPIDRSDARIEHGELPTVAGDRDKLGQVLTALLENSIVYADGRPRARIAAMETDGRCTVTIEDEGIGLDPEQVDRAFRVFGRLHGRDEYWGVGMGLPIARRIVERHGGTLVLEAGPGGRGVVAKMTLPVAGGEGTPP